MLHRAGNKKQLASLILEYFPEHDVYIEPFFGAGGLFFSKKLVKYNLVNDSDKEIFNYYRVVIDTPELFKEALLKTPMSQDLLDYWKSNTEKTDIGKAVRFAVMSNASFLGMGSQLKLGLNRPKENLLEDFDELNIKLKNVMFGNKDALSFLKSISFRRPSEIRKSFIYLDPPYQNTSKVNYSHGFTYTQLEDLLTYIIKKGFRFALSEYSSPIMDKIVTKFNLTKIILKERRSIKSRNIECLYINYTLVDNAYLI